MSVLHEYLWVGQLTDFKDNYLAQHAEPLPAKGLFSERIITENPSRLQTGLAPIPDKQDDLEIKF